MKIDDTNSFTLEGLVVPESTDTKASPKSGQKAARKRGELFIKITPVQADKLSKALRVSTVSVFFHILFRDYRTYHKSFTLPNDALVYAGISRHSQARALRNLVELGLITVERGGPRKPPTVTVIGAAKQG